MIYDVQIWMTVSLFVFGFGIVGIAIIAPFSERMKYPFLVAPLLGATLSPMCANIVYSITGASYRISVFSAIFLISVSLLMQRKRLNWKVGATQLLVGSVGISLAMILISDSRSLLLGGPAIFFKYGTDQSGYAQMADWLVHFDVNHRPLDDGGAWPYQSFPEFLVDLDPRFGTFGLLAGISTLTHVDGLFSYPVATAIIITCGILACGCIFARSWRVAILFMTVLLTCQWVDYGYIGFLGRIVAYPSIIVLCGLCFLSFRGEMAQFAALVAAAGSVGSAYPGFVVGILAATIVVPAMLVRSLADRRVSIENVVGSLITVLVPILSSGIASRPVSIGQIAQTSDFLVSLSRVLDIEDRSLPITNINPTILSYMVMASLALIVIGAVFSLLAKNYDAFSYLVGPPLFICALFAIGRNASVQEFAGFPLPAAVVGGALVVRSGLRQRDTWVLIVLIAQATLRIPRLLSAVSMFGYAPDPDYIFTMAEVKAIRHEIGARTVQIEAGYSKGLWLMSEIGQLENQVFWSSSSWHAILAYRSRWVYEAPSPPAQLLIKAVATGETSQHFEVVKNDIHATGE